MNAQQFEIDSSMYATHGQRVANFLIDYVCQLVLFFILVFAYTFFATLLGSEDIIDFEGMGTIAEYALGLVMLLVYYNLFEIFFSRTIAKFITKTVVVDVYGEKPSINTILTRSICRAIPFEVFSFLSTPCRGWHDSISDTYVVQKEIMENAKALFYSFDEIGKTEEEYKN